MCIIFIRVTTLPSVDDVYSGRILFCFFHFILHTSVIEILYISALVLLSTYFFPYYYLSTTPGGSYIMYAFVCVFSSFYPCFLWLTHTLICFLLLLFMLCASVWRSVKFWQKSTVQSTPFGTSFKYLQLFSRAFTRM